LVFLPVLVFKEGPGGECWDRDLVVVCLFYPDIFFVSCGLHCLVSIWNSMLLLTVHSFYSYSQDYVVPQGWIDSLFVHYGMEGFPSSLGILSFKY
jgi:hypothetical protein